MKHFLTLLMIVLFANLSQAQKNNFGDLWKTVEKFEAEGLPKSALEVVEQISVKAKEEKNAPQEVKVLLYKSKYALTLEEDAQLKIITDFKSEIATSEFPKSHILENLLANLYWQYFNQNRWQFYDRTNTESKVDPEDFRTWDLQTLFDEIHSHYQNSLQNGLLLQQEGLDQYNILLNTEKDSQIYRPTLFDFLAHNALEFYKTDENSITKPAYKFEINDPKFLGDSKAFAQIRIQSKDTSSLQLNALKIYQDLVQFHLKDKAPTALTDVNIQRLKYIKQHATYSDKEALLLQTLTSESAFVASHEAWALYQHEIAKIYQEQGNSYQPVINEIHRGKLKEAVAICDLVIKKFPKSKGAQNCQVLKETILRETLRLTGEEFLPIIKKSKLLIQYKNLETLNFSIYRLTRDQIKKLEKIYRQEEQLAFIKKLKSFRHWQSNLRNEDDHQLHSTEILFPNLNNGYYLIFASPETTNEKTFAFTKIQVTDLALVDKSNAKYLIYQVIDRNNGRPIENAKVTLKFGRNNNNTRVEKATTNAQGTIKIMKSKGRFWSLDAEIVHNKEKAYIDNLYANQYADGRDNDDTSYRAFLFTDRSIYRPGQAVFFKGIALKSKEGKSQVLADENAFATLHDVNGQKLSEIDLKTNDFGSFHGEFILPVGGLTGDFYIHTFITGMVDERHYFSVEEYKRPKFETTFIPISETFKVNDSVSVEGKALAYAGSNITNAKVVYRVHRKVQYPRWFYWYRPWFSSEPQEIAHGETKTDASGLFEVNFVAIPDQSVDKGNLPLFQYEVIADVTDINGETRSATTIINVGYHALTANITIDPKLDKEKKDHQVTIETKNLNGEFVPSNGTIKIYKLKAPQQVLRPRPWKAPDYQEFSKEEFTELFPHEAYANEHDSNNWQKGKLVFNSNFDTNTSKTVDLGKIKNWASGQYKIEVETKDKFGQLVKDEAKTIIYSEKDKTLADQQLFSIVTDKTAYNIGDDVQLTMGSAGSITVTIDIEKDHKIISSHIIHLNNNKEQITIPVSKNDIGGFMVFYSYAAYNSFKGQSMSINVPYPKSDLDIETQTFRDKLKPGQEETWRFKIKGPKGDQVTAEILASMYDLSLDQFKPHQWSFNPIERPNYYSYTQRSAGRSFGLTNFRVYGKPVSRRYTQHQSYDQFNWFGLYFGNSYRMQMRKGRMSGVMVTEDAEMAAQPLMMESDEDTLDEVVIAGNSIPDTEHKSEEPESFDDVQIRKNLEETAFFFPQLQTDNEGNVSFSFTTPESLTKWKFQLLAHNKTLESATSVLETVTQKELMVIPNAPRFLREGDHITISSKIANISEKPLKGQAVLQLYDAVTGAEIDTKLSNSDHTKSFSVDAQNNTQVSWNLSIPFDVEAVQYKIIAKAGEFSDGEQNVLPVLSNRMLVTESMPMWIRSNQSKTFTLDKLKNNSSTTLKHHQLTLEMTSNPAWYAVQALPYLMEFPYECNEQIFARYYANALATHIANSNPRIQEVFDQWASQDALLSNLEKNQELKSLLIQETPWLRDAQSETEQKKRIALLFNLNKMNNELRSSLLKLQNSQMSNGAWPWFNGGRPNRHITQHIVAGFTHLEHLENFELNANSIIGLGDMLNKAISYLDSEFVKEYHDLRKYDKNVDLSKDHLTSSQLQYLYIRSFIPDTKASKEVREIMDYYHSQIKSYWLKKPLYQKGLMALITHRKKDVTTANNILKSLRENSITSDELGMYWKENTSSWYWYQAPVETQALLIEAFSEIENDLVTIDNLKIWLLKNKQTNRWKTTKATTEAVFALLLQGNDWLSVTDMVDVVLGKTPIDPQKLEDVKVEAGTGYYKTSWNESEIKPEMAEVSIIKHGKGIAWGSLYWQYFEDLDKITSAETPLKLKKKLFLKSNTDKGEQLSELSSETKLQVGDLVRVRIELRSDRPMEFVHMKDMRASGLEPINVISTYKWQDGLGYYESTKDASTNFFFDYLPKGVFIFEHDLRVNNAGDFSNGITTIQSMYAPEFSSHSEGTRISVD